MESGMVPSCVGGYLSYVIEKKLQLAASFFPCLFTIYSCSIFLVFFPLGFVGLFRMGLELVASIYQSPLYLRSNISFVTLFLLIFRFR
ncbi:hypothetical protein EV426DRAFT_592370 [Tirmania nivea]|nr:hypothetical protein EV426DRAFT_592370 [Tirmania nivea]